MRVIGLITPVLHTLKRNESRMGLGGIGLIYIFNIFVTAFMYSEPDSKKNSILFARYDYGTLHINAACYHILISILVNKEQDKVEKSLSSPSSEILKNLNQF